MVDFEIIVEGFGQLFSGWSTIDGFETIMMGAVVLFGGGITVTIRNITRKRK